MSSAGSRFVPKDNLLAVLMNMGYSKNAATRALYNTGNCSGDLAAVWILDNQGQDLDRPFRAGADSDDSEDDPTMEGFLDTSDFYKMVFVVNSHLNMGTGKIAAQVGHASIGLYKQLISNQQKNGEMLLQWEQFGETKIVLKGENGQELMELATKAASVELTHYLVEDAGKTQVEAGSITVLALMGKNDVVDVVTGDLSLL